VSDPSVVVTVDASSVTVIEVEAPASTPALPAPPTVSPFSASVYGTGVDGDVTIAGTVALTRDMFYDNLTVSAGATLNPNGFRIFVRDTLTVDGTVQRNGRSATVDDGAVATAPGAGVNPVLGSGAAGGRTGHGFGGHDPVGVAGSSASWALGGAGGAGGTGSAAGGAGGPVLVPENGAYAFHDVVLALLGVAHYLNAFIAINGGGGGGGGGAYWAQYQATGGGGGAGGAVIVIAARHLAGAGVISSRGGDGAPSLLAEDGVGYGGGGGGGGGGGVIVLVTSDADTGAIMLDVSPGAGGPTLNPAAQAGLAGTVGRTFLHTSVL
jgi:hypothetical protein